ncbi:MAG: PEP-CTERM sorting domain-containing protein [Candidatus Acidiferrales bacterium]
MSLPGTVTENMDGTFSSGGIDTVITSVSGLSSEVSALPVFTPQVDQFNFSFSNVGNTLTSGGTFSFADLTEAGALTVTGEAEFGSTPSLTGPLGLVLDATAFTFNLDGLKASGTINVMGSATLNLDPGTVTSMTATVGFPNIGGSGGSGPSPTPEPGTLLLLGSGLTGLGFIRRRFVRA